MHLPNTSNAGQPNRKVTGNDFHMNFFKGFLEGEDNLQPPRTYPGWEENGHRNTNTTYNLFNGAFNQNIAPNGIKANEDAGFGSDQGNDQGQDVGDALSSPEKKGSNSKSKRGKNKKKKGSNSKNSSETNTTSIKNMADTIKGFDSLA